MSKETLATEELERSLHHFLGGGDHFEHWTKRLRFTEGIHFLAEQAGAFWLIDAVASYQIHGAIRKSVRLRAFQLWQLEVADRSAVLTCCEDSGQPPRIRQEIEFTDFPLEAFECYVCDGVMMLKNEY